MIELLTAAGASAVGIDQDPGQAAIAQSHGLRVVTAHAHEYLARRPNEYGGIFLRHVLEHFDGVEGLRLLYLCRKALKPGGIIGIVTPNFDMASVRHCIFWLDVTHQRPYPLPLLLHIFSALGLRQSTLVADKPKRNVISSSLAVFRQQQLGYSRVYGSSHPIWSVSARQFSHARA